MDDPDYDAFFRAYARGSACYYNDEGIKDMMENDNHLPARERINFILAQFDEFYDTYDVDPESPYYVPEGERLGTLLWK